MQSCTTLTIHSYLKTSVLIQYVFLPYLLPFFFLSHCAFFHTFTSEHHCTPVQCFYKGWIESNQQLALSLLIHNIHCGSSVFPYKVHKRPAQHTLIALALLILYKPSISLPCHFSPGRYRQYVSPKCWHRPTHQHSAKTQKLKNTIIITMRNLNLIFNRLCGTT
jgi:hypothetical protein